MDEELKKALDEMTDDFGLTSLDEVLAEPEPHIYRSGRDCRQSL